MITIGVLMVKVAVTILKVTVFVTTVIDGEDYHDGQQEEHISEPRLITKEV
jgi:hypothetical protein